MVHFNDKLVWKYEYPDGAIKNFKEQDALSPLKDGLAKFFRIKVDKDAQQVLKHSNTAEPGGRSPNRANSPNVRANVGGSRGRDSQPLIGIGGLHELQLHAEKSAPTQNGYGKFQRRATL
jgi:hypothetical protein